MKTSNFNSPGQRARRKIAREAEPRRFRAVDRHLAGALVAAYLGRDYRPLIHRAQRIALKIEARADRKGVRRG